jgi:hypothetical protein
LGEGLDVFCRSFLFFDGKKKVRTSYFSPTSGDLDNGKEASLFSAALFCELVQRPCPPPLGTRRPGSVFVAVTAMPG